MAQKTKYKAVVHEAEEGGYWAEVPELPGCITEGDTLDELKANLQEAASGWLIANRTRGMEDFAALSAETHVDVLEFA